MIVKLVVAEASSPEVRRLVTGGSLVSSRVAVVEVTKAVARVSPVTDVASVLAFFTFIEFDPELARRAAATGGSMLRALDAIHVASALRVVEELDAFVMYDARQASAAAAAGLRVLSPGAELQWAT